MEPEPRATNRCRGMLQADKQVLLAGVKRNALELRQKELDFNVEPSRVQGVMAPSAERPRPPGHAKQLAAGIFASRAAARE